MEYDLNVYPISRAIDFSHVREFIAGYIEKELSVIYGLADSFDLIPLEGMMEHVGIPYVIHDIYRKAIAIRKASNEKFSFEALTDDILKGLADPDITDEEKEAPVV